MNVRLVCGLVTLLFFSASASHRYKPIGCYKDSAHGSPRPLPKLLANFRSKITDWTNFKNIIASCSELAQSKGYRYFGVQFYGECWSGENNLGFDKEGTSLHCVNGVGEAGANFVYEITSTATLKCGVKPSSRIIGGKTAVPNEWPWLVDVLMFDRKQNQFVHRCGGTLINKWWIVTAAHCLFQNIDPKNYKIRLGEHDRSKFDPGEMELTVSVIHIHSRFFTKNYGYDIAIMKLSAPAIINSKILPVCLPKQYQQVDRMNTRNCFVAGWGMTRYGGPHANVLQQAELPLVSHKVCSAVNGALQEVDKFTMLCAGHGGNSSASGCHGDSGGPFVCQEDGGRWFLRGVVSWGDQQCRSKTYSVFARVSSFIDWIECHMNKKPLEKPIGCVDAHFYCEEWKAKGWCNGDYLAHMLKGYYCKKTCGACKTGIQA